MTVLSKTPQQDKLHRYNSLLDVLAQAKRMARNNNCNQRVMDAIENTTAIVYYEMTKTKNLYEGFADEYPTDYVNDR